MRGECRKTTTRWCAPAAAADSTVFSGRRSSTRPLWSHTDGKRPVTSKAESRQMETCEDRWEGAVRGLRDRYAEVSRQLVALTEEMARLRLGHLVLEQLLASGGAGECVALLPVAPAPVLSIRSVSVTSQPRGASKRSEAPHVTIAPAPPPRTSAPAALKKTRAPGSEELILARERARALHRASYRDQGGQRARGLPAGSVSGRGAVAQDNPTRRFRRGGY